MYFGQSTTPKNGGTGPGPAGWLSGEGSVPVSNSVIPESFTALIAAARARVERKVFISLFLIVYNFTKKAS